MTNAVFNPVIYEMSGGKIIDFDPAKESRKRARERAAKRLSYEKELRSREREERIKRKRVLKLQKKLGLIFWMFGIIASVMGFVVPILWLSIVPFCAIVGAIAIFSKKTIL